MASLLLLAACSRNPPAAPAPVITPELAARSVIPSPEAQDCGRCHPKAYEAWLGSQHAHANRLLDPATDGTRLATGPAEARAAEAVIGITPLLQYLVPAPGGRLQAFDPAFDPRSNEWFQVFADARERGDWGHWTGRGLTWNSQCASCHMTDFQKNYNPTNDTYASTWKAMGISCTQCHRVDDAPSSTHHVCPVARTGPAAPTGSPVAVQAAMDTCATCHARREELTAAFRPGDRFDDHYRLALPDQQGLYHADGQVREEDFEFGSFRMSRMGHRGIACRDCHDSHSGKLILPVEQNALCLSCHLAPGQRNAITVDPATHSHHAPGTPGSRCIDCHMPVTHFMMRDPRRDHGFTSPDPRLTIELDIPNACNRCHTDRSPEWSETWTTQWYGEKMERPARQRARLVARAWAGDESVVTALVAAAASEEIAAWRATLTALLSPWKGHPDARALIERHLRDPEPLVRSAAVRALANARGSYDVLKPLRRDASRLVRLDAAQATANELEREGVDAQEVAAYLRVIDDQPAGALRNAEAALKAGRRLDAESWARRTVAWDASPAAHHALGLLLHQLGKIEEAVSELGAASRGETNNAIYTYTLALAQGEAGRAGDALVSLQETVRRDPHFGRAWYNLGLAQAGLEKLPEAVASLQTAGELMPESAEAPYALATVHLRQKDRVAARAAAQEALAREPGHLQARALLLQLGDPP